MWFSAPQRRCSPGVSLTRCDGQQHCTCENQSPGRSIPQLEEEEGKNGPTDAQERRERHMDDQ